MQGKVKFVILHYPPSQTGSLAQTRSITYRVPITYRGNTCLDLSRAVSQSEMLYIIFRTKSEEPVTIKPLSIEARSLYITGYSELVLQPILSPPQTKGNLFTVSDEAYLTLTSLFHQFKSSTTEPLIIVCSGSWVRLEYSAFTSDDGVHSAPLVHSSSSTLFVDDTSVYNFTFAGQSCFECDGGSFKLEHASYSTSAVVVNITTTGDGAVVNSRNADVNLYQVHLFDCHARNGGVAFLQKCQDVYVRDMQALRCSAEGKGGAFFIHSVDATADITLKPTLIDCSAEHGGGMFLDMSHFKSLTLSHQGYADILQQNLTVNMLSNCFAQTGARIFFDGDWSDVGTVSFGSLPMSNGGPLVSGHDLFFSQSLSESFPDLELLLQNLTEQSWSMSTLASDDDPFKQVVVEGRPELSRNLDCPKIVLIASDSPTYQCISDKLSKSSSLSDYLPLLHLKDENNEYRQIPIFLQHTVYFYQTGVVTEQSILLTPETLTDPAQLSTLSLGYDYWEEDRFFLRIEKGGQGTAKISSCSIILDIAMSRQFISCSAGVPSGHSKPKRGLLNTART
ncbi:hypothetical protein BLNAU_7096 [Blattamonas nauphoetae]|uniref:Right handed beta helix domain-containing protein n=1 Tax=Blattamonas nauphoetae TaxID=2049346 RepID=A0ABQ9Y2I4_9EUKA|nr:hypothetical protein BLNAU_7096 [Blattamonas nauphoetae]